MTLLVAKEIVLRIVQNAKVETVLLTAAAAMKKLMRMIAAGFVLQKNLDIIEGVVI